MTATPMTDAERVRLERLMEGYHPEAWALTAAEARSLFARLATLGAENAALKAKMAEADRALEPFAGIGAWLFARDLPDVMPLVDILGINGASGVLTRGDFKAAHTARGALLQGGDDADH